MVPASKRSASGFLLLLLPVTLLFCAGCPDDPSEPGIPALQGMYEWGSVPLDGTEFHIYAPISQPKTQYTPILIYPDPSLYFDPAGGTLNVDLLIEIAGEIQGAPSSQTCIYNADNLVFEGFIAPSRVGQWVFQLTWLVEDATFRGYLPLDVRMDSTFSRVGAITTTSRRGVAAWIEPMNPVVGENVFTLRTWRSANGLYNFVLDDSESFLIRVFNTFTLEESDENVAPELIGNGLYSGTANFPTSGDWTVELTSGSSFGNGNHYLFRFEIETGKDLPTDGALSR